MQLEKSKTLSNIAKKLNISVSTVSRKIAKNKNSYKYKSDFVNKKIEELENL